MNKEGFIQVNSVDLMNNRKLVVTLNILALPLLILFVFTFYQVTRILSLPLVITTDQLLIGATLTFVLMISHELIHGLFFKIYQPKANIKFGAKLGVFYAISPGSLYSKCNYATIGLSPFIIISAALTAACAFGVLSPLAYILAASLHGAGCIGDFYTCYLLLKAKKGQFIEDTSTTINFYERVN